MPKICPIKTAGAFAGMTRPNTLVDQDTFACLESACAWWAGEACAVTALATVDIQGVITHAILNNDDYLRNIIREARP